MLPRLFEKARMHQESTSSPGAYEPTMSETDDPIRRDPEARQFSIRRLLVLAVLCAVIGGTGQVVGLSPNRQVIFTFVLMGVAFYIVFRLPYVTLWHLGRTSRWKRLKAQRAELEDMADRKRREFRESQEDTDRDRSAG
jgi:type VI protein secretion system component VasK